MTDFQNGEIVEIPLFPLPNVVFFPNTLLPLHIFEPRFRQMTTDVLHGNRQIGMCLLRYGRENLARSPSDSYAIGGMGMVSKVRKYPDGRFDLVLEGTSRFRILELTRSQPYRWGRVVLLPDVTTSEDAVAKVGRRLFETYSELARFREETSDLEELEKLDFPRLINLICASLNVGVHSKQSLLEIDGLERRGRALLQILQTLIQQENVVRAFQHLRTGDPSAN